MFRSWKQRIGAVLAGALILVGLPTAAHASPPKPPQNQISGVDGGCNHIMCN